MKGKVFVAQSCCSLRPHGLAQRAPLRLGILQARTLEWVAIPFSGGPSQLRDGAWVPCSAGSVFTAEPSLPSSGHSSAPRPRRAWRVPKGTLLLGAQGPCCSAVSRRGGAGCFLAPPAACRWSIHTSGSHGGEAQALGAPSPPSSS